MLLERGLFWRMLYGVLEYWSEPLPWCMPVVQHLPLDLFRLFYAVVFRGGYVSITHDSMWPSWLPRRVAPFDPRVEAAGSSLTRGLVARPLTAAVPTMHRARSALGAEAPLPEDRVIFHVRSMLAACCSLPTHRARSDWRATLASPPPLPLAGLLALEVSVLAEGS
jgi:hypothetical protein